MAYDVRKLWSQKDFTIDALQGFGSTEYYSVTADTTAELADDLAVANAVGSNGEQVPPINASHPNNRDLRVAFKNAGAGLVERIVSVRYQYAQGGLSFEPNTNPLSRKPRISWQRNVYQEPVGRDIYNNPIANSAGDSIEPPPTINMASRMLTIRRFEQGYKPEISDRFENTVNQYDIFASGRKFPAGTVLIHSIVPLGEYTDGTAILDVEYQLEVRWKLYRPPGVQASVIEKNPFYYWRFDTGLRGWYTPTNSTLGEPVVGDLYFGSYSGTTLVPTDNRVSEAVPLDGKGRPLDQSVVVGPTGGTPVKPIIAYAGKPPLSVRVGDVYMLGSPIYRPDDMLLLGL